LLFNLAVTHDLSSCPDTQIFSSLQKLHDSTAADVDAAVDVVVNSPKIGDKKKGDLP